MGSVAITNYFNPRSREGSDPASTGPCHPARNFNPRSREGSDLSCSYPMTNPSHFNPRSREGSDVRSGSGTFTAKSISIHAPVKGATKFLGQAEK